MKSRSKKRGNQKATVLGAKTEEPQARLQEAEEMPKAAHRQAQAELEKHRHHLEELIEERTSQVEAANEELRAEITERKRAEEALRHAKRLSDALNRINAVLHSTLELDRIAGRLVAEGAAALGCDTAAISFREDNGWTVGHVHGMPAELVGTRMTDDQERHAVLAITSRQAVAVEDAFNDERVNREHLRRHDVRSVLVAPLIARDEPSGVLFFNYHGEPHAFTEAEVSFARQLAATAGVAIENARLFDERKRAEEAIRRAAARFEILSATAGELLRSKEPHRIVDTLCGNVMEHLDCHIFVNYLVDGDVGRLHLNAWAGLPERSAKAIEWLDFGQAICGRVAQEGKRIVAENIQESCDPRADLVRSLGIRAYACHPITAQDRVIGTVSFGTRSRTTFSEDDLAMMKTVTDQVGTAMERVRSEQALLEMNEQLERRVRQRTAELQRTTDLVKAEQRRFKEVLDQLPAYLVLLSPDHHVPFANRFFNERFGKAEGRRCYEYLFDRGEPCENCESFKVLSTNAPHHWEWTGPDGRNYDIYDFPFTDVDGSKLVMEVGLDITERKRAEAAIQEANEMLEQRVLERTTELARSNQDLQQFAYVASHDLQEPLRTVSSFVELLQRRYSGKLDQTADEYIAFAVAGAKHMQDLIKDLLAYSRIGAPGPALAPIATGEALKRAIANLESAIEKSGAVITNDAMPTGPADPTRLTQLFQNLLGNAIKFSRPGVRPEIHVGAVSQQNDWLFSVRDNGIGIPAKQFQRIFLIFQRLHTRDKYPGTGIGLAVCRRIVEQHGGRIWVESEIGQGTTFWFTIPQNGVEKTDEPA